ncbi:MAG: glycosyltransferase family 4 protein [Patescibacteria group bacterium]
MRSFCLITLDYPPQPGGVGVMYRQLCLALAPYVSVVTTPLANGQIDIHDESYQLQRLRLLSKNGWPKWRKLFFDLMSGRLPIASNGIVLVGQILPVGIAVWLASHFKKISYAVFVHGMDITTAVSYPRRRWVIQHILARAKVVLAANEFIKAYLVSLGVAAEKIRVIYPIVPALPSLADERDALRLRLNIANNFVILTVARLVERKGVDIVIVAMEQVWQEVPTAKYYIVGDGPAREKLEKLRQRSSRPEQIVLLGKCSDKEAIEWRAAADLFVMVPKTLANNDTEGIGIAILEASAAGLPVIGSKHGGVPEGIEDSKTGVLIAERDSERLAEVIIDFAKYPDKRMEFGKAGRKMVSERFNAKKVGNEFLSIFGLYD